MKKALAISAVGLFLVIFSFACERKSNPLSAVTGSFKVKDAAPVTVITNVSMSVTVSNGLTIANCNDNSINNNLYCGPYPPNAPSFPVPITLSIPPDGSLSDGALYCAGDDIDSIQIYGTPVHVLQPGNHACGALLWSGTQFGQIVESYDFGAVMSLFSPKGASTITINFDTSGCFAYGLFYTFTQPVTTILTPVPQPTNTFTPVPTNTFTPLPTNTPIFTPTPTFSPTPNPTVCVKCDQTYLEELNQITNDAGYEVLLVASACLQCVSTGGPKACALCEFGEFAHSVNAVTDLLNAAIACDQCLQASNCDDSLFSEFNYDYQ